MLLFLIDIYIFGFDIAPDFVGWMSMLGAVAMLTGKVKGIERIRTFGQVMLGYELAMVVLNYVGGMLPFYDLIMGYVGIFILCIRMYFMYIILTAAAEVGMVEGGEEKTIQGICRSRSLVLWQERRFIFTPRCRERSASAAGEFCSLAAMWCSISRASCISPF